MLLVTQALIGHFTKPLGVTCPWQGHALFESALWNGAGRRFALPVSTFQGCALRLSYSRTGSTRTGIAREGAIPIQAEPFNYLSEL